MSRPWIIVLCLWAVLLAFVAWSPGRAAEDPAIVRFRGQEIDRSLQVGYAVLLVDLNGDGKKDIVVVDTTRVVWFENPTWKLRTIIQGQTRPDNVCIDAYDIDGDGQLELALGAEWKPFNTKTGGTLQWLRRGRTLDEPWTVHPITDDEPTIHRIRFADIDADGRAELLVGPLMGRGSTREKNWMDAPLKVTAYRIPRDPARDRWTPEVLDENLHVMHNFWPTDVDGDGRRDVLTASYEGVSLLRQGSPGRWTRTLLHEGNQKTPQGNRGASEIKLGRLKNGQRFIATVEPWHGHEVVVYTPPASTDGPWTRQVLDDQLKWGHAVWCADLDGDGDEELIIGVRDPLNDQMKSGVRVYKARNPQATQWSRQIVDNGSVAVEDLAAADLNGDGRPDLVAVGRASKNVKIFWNEGKSP